MLDKALPCIVRDLKYLCAHTQDEAMSADMYEGIPLGDSDCNIGRIARHERRNGHVNSTEDPVHGTQACSQPVMCQQNSKVVQKRICTCMAWD